MCLGAQGRGWGWPTSPLPPKLTFGQLWSVNGKGMGEAGFLVTSRPFLRPAVNLPYQQVPSQPETDQQKESCKS